MVVHEIPENAVFGVIKAIFSDYESGGYRFPHSDPYGRILSDVLTKAPHSMQSKWLFLCL